MNLLTPFPNVFEKRRVFVTGHTGFKGSWLTVWLHALGADITGYALPPESEDGHFAQLGLERMIRHIEGDIRDADRLNEAIFNARPEFVFHLAAQPLVRRSYREPKLTFDTNIGGSVNLLESIRSVGTVRVLIYVTSDKCYQPVERRRGLKETDPLGGHDPYSASKACAELILNSYRASYFDAGNKLAAASVRAGNIIGGGDWSEDRIVPDCIRSLSAGRAIPIRNPEAVRPWQHVLEPIGGYLRLAAFLRSQGPDYRGAWNFGPAHDSHRPVQELVEGVIAAWGSGKIALAESSTRFPETQLLYLNCDKAAQVLDWHPTWDFHQSVERTVEWYKHALNGADVWKLTTWQLQAYCAMLRSRALAEGPAA